MVDAGTALFRGDPETVRLIAQAYRLQHAYLFNPAFATETSLIDLLPHQLAAVYGVPPSDNNPDGQPGMIDHPRLRFLLGDDAGAGKTIMAGLTIREMILRHEGLEESEWQDQQIVAATDATTVEELQAEIAEVGDLVRLARRVYGMRQESKSERLWEALEAYPDTKVLIFTEFRDTLEFLLGRLEGKRLTGQVAHRDDGQRVGPGGHPSGPVLALRGLRLRYGPHPLPRPRPLRPPPGTPDRRSTHRRWGDRRRR